MSTANVGKQMRQQQKINISPLLLVSLTIAGIVGLSVGGYLAWYYHNFPKFLKPGEPGDRPTDNEKRAADACIVLLAVTGYVVAVIYMYEIYKLNFRRFWKILIGAFVFLLVVACSYWLFYHFKLYQDAVNNGEDVAEPWHSIKNYCLYFIGGVVIILAIITWLLLAFGGVLNAVFFTQLASH